MTAKKLPAKPQRTRRTLPSSKPKPAATLNIHSAGLLNAKQRLRVVNWLHRQADEFDKGYSEYTLGRFTARLAPLK